ncbi:ras-related protein Rab-13-like [Dysidea avara]|uniref:ras-related protein Rab-13-like n=1 Tax=Dysidea avara TaxID=196820 RepID=UPI003324A28D
MSSKNYDYLFKVLLCGDSGVGKTCLLCQFVDNEVRKSHIATIGIDFKLKTLEVKGKKIRLQIWDTAGQERFETLTSQYYRRAQGILLVYDLTDQRTFTNTSKWLRSIEENAVSDVKKVLIANKLDAVSDTPEKRQVSTRQGMQLAKENGVQFFETSAFTAENISEAFSSLTESILQDMESRFNRDVVASQINNEKLTLQQQQQPQEQSGCFC